MGATPEEALSWVARREQLVYLATRAEQRARALAGERPAAAGAPRDLVALLESTCELLERIVPRTADEDDELPTSTLVDADEGLASTLPDLPETAILSPPHDTIPIASATTRGPDDLATRAMAAPAAPAAPVEPPGEQKPSETARHLIKLRDAVLLARTGESAPPPSLLDSLYRELGRVLEREGVESVDRLGGLDDALQTVVDTRATDDPSQDNVVLCSVRPGYVFNGRLVRPQEVIVYSFEG